MTQAEPPVGRLGATSIDCPNPTELADFYSRLLGMRRMVETPDGGVVAITDGAHILAMMRVDDYVPPTWPEPGQHQQMHLDVSVTDLDDGGRPAPSGWAPGRPGTRRTPRCGASCSTRSATRSA